MIAPDPLPLTPAHAALAAHIHAAAFPAGEAWSASAFATLLTLTGVLGWIMPDAAGLLLARHVLDEAELLTLAILPERQRQGLGRRLVQTWIMATEHAGIARLYLEVSDRNRAASALYASLGFHPHGTRKAYYKDGSAARLLVRAGARDADRISPPFR